MKINIRTGPVRKKPSVGDRKIIKGVEHIRQLEIINHPLYGRCYNRTGGRDHFVWIPVHKLKKHTVVQNRGTVDIHVDMT